MGQNEGMTDDLEQLIRDDHDLLLKIALHMEQLGNNVKDHEARMRTLERSLYYGLGAFAIFSWIFQFAGKHV